MKKKFMEIICPVFLFTCLVAIAIKHWWHVKSEKKRSSETEPSELVDLLAESTSKKSRNDLQHTFDTVNMWVNNCDQKAGILLSVIGVAMTVILTSDFLKELKTDIFAPFVKYWTEETDFTFSWSRFTVFVLLVIAASMLITSCYYFFKAISANIDYEKMYKENPGLVRKSYIFFGTISGMSFDDFEKEDVCYDDDLRSQIYVNSKIAIMKFKNYIRGLYWLKFLLIVAAMLFVAIMFVK